MTFNFTNIFLLIQAIIILIPFYWITWKVFFKDWDQFIESVRAFFTPEIFSVLRGSWVDDSFEALKFFILMIIFGLSTYFVYNFLK